MRFYFCTNTLTTLSMWTIILVTIVISNITTTAVVDSLLQLIAVDTGDVEGANMTIDVHHLRRHWPPCSAPTTFGCWLPSSRLESVSQLQLCAAHVLLSAEPGLQLPTFHLLLAKFWNLFHIMNILVSGIMSISTLSCLKSIPMSIKTRINAAYLNYFNYYRLPS